MASVPSRLQHHVLQLRVLKDSLRTLMTSTQTRTFRKRRVQGNVAAVVHSATKTCSCGERSYQTGTTGSLRFFYDKARKNLLDVDPFQIVKPEIDTLCEDINKTFTSNIDELRQMSQYYFDGKGKAFRPMLVMLMAKALNYHISKSDRLLESQQKIAMISEMIHTASLIHDDVIDGSSIRRGKTTVDAKWGQKKAIAAGDYILSVSSMLLAQIRNEDVVQILSQVIEDLVRGEFMQLGSKEDATERFNHYLKKTFKKTATLMAHSCKAVAVLGNCNEEIAHMAFHYGRHIGIAFQLVDDLLDFASNESVMGKPTSADLKLGLATAPVLFAAQSYEELNPMIMRRFSLPGDVERARELVAMSDGIDQTKMLALQHSTEAVNLIMQLQPSLPRDGLEKIAYFIINRSK